MPKFRVKHSQAVWEQSCWVVDAESAEDAEEVFNDPTVDNRLEWAEIGDNVSMLSGEIDSVEPATDLDPEPREVTLEVTHDSQSQPEGWQWSKAEWKKEVAGNITEMDYGRWASFRRSQHCGGKQGESNDTGSG